MELIADILLDAAKDTLSLVPFLFFTYMALELLEHMAGERVNAAVKRAGAAGPVVGALLGIVPQCGFSAAAATLYAGRVVTIGTLVAVFLSTSDETLPLLLAEQVDVALMVQILLVKAGIAAAVGLLLDAGLRALRGNARMHAALRRTVLGAKQDADLLDELAEAGTGADHIHELCERAHCGCEPDGAHVGGGRDSDEGDHSHGVARNHSHGHAHAHAHTHGEHGLTGCSLTFAAARGAVTHTVQVTVFIFLVTLVLVALLETVGEDALAGFLAGNRVLAVFASGLVGLIPNCAASVVITQLYLEGVLSFGVMLTGSLVSVGVGFLVLFRTNQSLRENIAILVLLYVVGVACGLALTAFGV